MTPILAQKPRADRAFERLYRKHAGDVYRYALVVLRNQADAEDVTQTTFLNAYRAFERGERPRTPQNWLIAIAHNVCRQRFRQSMRRPSEISLDEDLAEDVVDEERISAEDIRRALGHLAFNQRAAIVMRELEGRSYQEIAEILDVSVSAVETLIFRARRALREQLEGGLTCHEAELAVSRQLDGRLSRKDRGALRAHLRECEDCAHFARSQRAQRGALKSLAAIPLPQSLASFFGGGGGGAAVGSGLAVKAAAIGASAMVVTGVGYEGVKHGILHPSAQKAAHRAVPPAKAPEAAAALGLRTNDLRPFRPAAVAAREQVERGKALGKSAVPKQGRGREGLLQSIGKEVSPLPPSRAQGPRKPTPALTRSHGQQGQAKGRGPSKPPPPKPVKPPKPPPPPHRQPPPSPNQTIPPGNGYGKSLP